MDPRPNPNPNPNPKLALALALALALTLTRRQSDAVYPPPGVASPGPMVDAAATRLGLGLG